MHAASAPARLARAHHRFELRTLTHVGLDATNGGIVRNLTHAGIAMQAVSPPQVGDVIRVRIELRHPKLRMEFQGQVIWVTPTGQCGFRFLDATPRTTRQINEWIFGNLLDSSRHWTRAGSIFAAPEATTADDGLVVSQASPQVIRIEPAPQTEVLSTAATDAAELRHIHPVPDEPQDEPVEREWMSRPISARTLARTIDGMMVTAALLIVLLVFLSITHEFPRWPLNVEVAVGGVAFVLIFYWGFFRAFGGASLGTRLARLVDEEPAEPIEDADRFR
jgi:Tfp pilus assembly protein PilZ